MRTRALVALLVSALQSQSSWAQSWNAVCVGIDNYPGENDLLYCVEDATQMKNYLINYKQWNANDISLMTNSAATESSILNEVGALSTTGGNTNLFFFSGHGDSYVLGGSDGIVPANSISARITPAELNSALQSYSQSAVIVDACGSGIFANSGFGVFATASASNEESWEDDGNDGIEHGYYTYYILAGLAQSSLNALEEVHSYASPLTVALSEELAEEVQHPQLGDNFYGYLTLYNSEYTTSGTLQRYETWSAPTSLQGNVYVPSGVVLTLCSNLSLTFNGYHIESTGGVIAVQPDGITSYAYITEGGPIKAIYQSIQQAINNVSGSQVVQLQPRTYSESPSISGKSNLTLCGAGQSSTTIGGNVSITSSTSVRIADFTISGAVTINNSSQTLVESITGTGSVLAYCYGGTTNDIRYVSATEIGASFGFSAYGGTGNLYYSSIRNGDLAVYLTNNASYNIGTNNTFCGNGLDIYANNGGYAYAITNQYSCPIPGSVYGNVFVTGQNSACSEECGGFRIMASPQSLPVKASAVVVSYRSPLYALDNSYLTILRDTNPQASTSKRDISSRKSDVSRLISDYGRYICDSTSVKDFASALSRINELHMLIDDRTGFYDRVTAALKSSVSSEHRPYLLRYLVWSHVLNAEFDVAVRLADEVLSIATADRDLYAEMLYEKGLIFEHYLNAPEMARQMGDELADISPPTPLAHLASIAFGGSRSLPAEEVEQHGFGTTDVGQLEVFPNPFNPSTEIRYAVTDPGEIRLEVFDILGRPVDLLVNETKAMGIHSVKWHGDRFPSGMYLLRLVAGGKTSIKRLMLAK